MAETEEVSLLLVEDDPQYAQTLALMLRRSPRLRCSVVQAGSLAQARSLLSQAAWDLLLLDLNLPDSHGLDTLLAMRRLAPGPALVVVTGQGDEDLGRQALQAGAQDYLHKPDITAALLSRALLYALERKRAQDRQTQARHELEEQVQARTRELQLANQALKEQLRERRQAEEALRQSEKKFFTVFKHAPIMAAISVLEDGTLLDVNDKFLEVSGFRREEVLGKTSIEIGWLSDGDRRRLLQVLQRRGKIANLEVTSHAKGGRPVGCLYNCELVEIGGARRLLTLLLDITERKQAEEALREAHDSLEQRVRQRTADLEESNQVLLQEIQARQAVEESLVVAHAAIQSSLTPIILVDMTGRLSYVNASALRLWGYAQDSQVLGRHVAEFVGRPGLTKKLLERVLRRERLEITLNGRKEDGGLLPLRLALNLVRDLEGQPLCIMISMVDLSQLKQGQEALRASRETLRVLLDTMSEPALLLDPQGTLLAANRALGRSLGGREPKALVGSSIYDHLDPQTAQARKAFVDQAVRTASLVRFEDQRRGRFFAHTLSPILDRRGRVKALAALTVDVTEHRLATEHLRRINRALLALSKANQEVLWAQDESQLMRGVCRVAVEQGGHDLAWVGLIGQDDPRQMRLAAAWGLEEDHHELLGMTWADGAAGPGLAGRAIQGGLPALTRDLASDRDCAPLAEAARRHGLNSGIALPLLANQQCLGVLNIYSGQADAFDKEETALFMDLAGVLSLGIATLRERQQRQQAQEALLQSQRTLAKVLQTSPVWTTLTSQDQSIILEVNETFLRTSGHDRREVIGSNGLALNLWPDPGQRAAGLAKVEAEGRLRELPVTLRMKDGQLREFLWSVEPVDIDGQPCMVNVMADISERKQAEDALRQSEETLRLMFDHAPLGIFLMDNQNIIVGCNDHLTTIIGVPKENILGLNVFELPIDNQARQALLEAMSGGPGLHEGPYTPPSTNKRLYLRTAGRQMRDATGKPAGLIVLVEDISQRKQDEDALRQSEETLRMMFDHAPLGIFHLDNQGVTVACNDYLAKMIDVPKEQLIGVNLLMLPPDNPARIGVLEAVAQGQGHYEGPYTSLISGRQVYLRAVARQARDAAGRPAGVIILVEDISQRKQAELEQAKLEALLRQAQKMEAIGTLAGGIAHDFNNILAIIMTNAELAVPHLKAEDKPAQNLRRILSATVRGTELVEQILTISRKREHDRRPMDVTPVVKETLKLLRATLPTTVRIRSELRAAALKIKADPVDVQQVLMNLSTNAVHAMRDQGGVLRVCLDEVDGANLGSLGPGLVADERGRAYLRLAVSDDGQGIPAEVLPRIFEPYFTTKAPDKGTGLGLAVVQGVVQACGGQVCVQSRPGQGTTFQVLLPQADQEQEPAPPPPAQTPLARGARVFLVDDEPDILEAGQAILQGLGYEVLTFEGGLKALEALRANPQAVDLIITDQTMPGLTGLDLAKEARGLRPDLPVILCTGYSQARGLEALGPAGLSGVLKKPFTTQTLYQAMAHALHSQAPGRAHHHKRHLVSGA